MAQFLTLLSILLLVAVFNPDKHESSALAVPGSEEDSVDYFPIKVKELNGTITQLECLEIDENPLYCNKLRHYPDKENIDKLLNEEFVDFKSYFNNKLEPPSNISYRINGRNVEYLCSTRYRNIFPEAIRGEDDFWIIIPQSKEYKQGFAIEECDETDEICGEKMGINIPKKYKARCKQHYVRRAFASAKSARFMKAEVRIEACCKCDIIDN